MQNSMLSAYLSCVLLTPAQAADDRPELRATLVSPTGSEVASTTFDPSGRCMFSDVPPGEGGAVGITSTPHLQAPHDETDRTYKRWFVGSTFLMLGNLIPNDRNPPEFMQLNVGYRITAGNVVFLELKKSRFAWPLGIPWGKSFDAPGENYPGYVRQNVIGLAYNRFWWKGLYTGVHGMNAFQKYYDEGGRKIANGYTLFMTYRLGYQLKFFKNRFFFEPSIGLTHWPIKTNTPESFKSKESKWPKYFAFEPGLHFGFNF